MIGFLHIPKTGGTSVRTAYERDHVVWRPRGDRYPTTLCVPDLDGVEMVTGHIPFALFLTLPITVWVTVLRHPVDRWLSHYYAEVGDRGCWPPVDVVPDNLACRMLTDFTVNVDRAVANLARFDHVGFTDRLDATFAHLGVVPMDERRSLTRPPCSPAWLVAAAVAANRADLELYERMR